MSDVSSLPTHVGIILDGNRRWAKAHGKPVQDGHIQGLETLKDISLYAFDKGVSYISAYVFSTENWSRAQEEVSFLMSLALKAVEKHLNTFHEAGVRLVMIGSRAGVADKVLQAIDKAIAKTAQNTRGTLSLCFNYGGRQEIIDSIKQIIQKGIPADVITPETISAALYEPSIPDVDLLIRTSGEYRTSGFMLWRAAYAELYFADKYWPDFRPADLDAALNDYAKRQRRFGK